MNQLKNYIISKTESVYVRRLCLNSRIILIEKYFDFNFLLYIMKNSEWDTIFSCIECQESKYGI